MLPQHRNLDENLKFGKEFEDACIARSVALGVPLVRGEGKFAPTDLHFQDAPHVHLELKRCRQPHHNPKYPQGVVFSSQKVKHLQDQGLLESPSCVYGLFESREGLVRATVDGQEWLYARTGVFLKDEWKLHCWGGTVDPNHQPHRDEWWTHNRYHVINLSELDFKRVKLIHCDGNSEPQYALPFKAFTSFFLLSDAIRHLACQAGLTVPNGMADVISGMNQ